MMSGSNTHFLQRCAGSVLIVAAIGIGSTAHAADWKPERPVEIVAMSGPGGANDVIARTLQRVMQQKKMVDAPMTVVSKVGAGGVIAWNYLNQHAGDGGYISVSPINLLIEHGRDSRFSGRALLSRRAALPRRRRRVRDSAHRDFARPVARREDFGLMAMANLKAAIAGIGESRVGRVPDRSALQLQTDAAQAALTDAGLKMSDIDGLLTTPVRVEHWNMPTATPPATDRRCKCHRL